MVEKISKEVFEHLVELAAMKLGEDEAVYLLEQLNKQLTSIEELAQIEIDDSVEPAAHGVPFSSELSGGLRPDVIGKFPSPDLILEQAPELIDRYFVVPDTNHEDLD